MVKAPFLKLPKLSLYVNPGSCEGEGKKMGVSATLPFCQKLYNNDTR